MPLSASHTVAPEVLIGQGHNRGADFWSLGVVLFEILDGSTPFDWEGASQRDVFECIINCDYKCPDYFSDDAKDIIGKLLVKDDNERLGTNSPRGHLDVMEHSWFDSISFKKLRKKEINAPWVPQAKDGFDASNFSEYNPDEVEPPYRELSEAEQEEFRGF